MKRSIQTWKRGLIGLLCLAATTAHAADRYEINQTFGEIGFTVTNFGTFTSHGGFKRWDGTLTIDQDHPERSKVDVTIQAASVFMPWDDGTALLRSPAYFDVVAHPDIHFSSDTVRQVAANRFAIHGTLRVRGIDRPQDFDAMLVDHRVDPATHAEIADFRVTGTLLRSWFGMTADPIMTSDAVAVVINTRLRLGEALRDR